MAHHAPLHSIPSMGAMETIFGDGHRTDRELAMVLLFDADHRLIHSLRFNGVYDGITLSLRGIVREALAGECVCLLIYHSHMSGDPRPSAADIAVTRTLCRILRPLGVTVCDHMIQAGPDWFSFRAEGLL